MPRILVALVVVAAAYPMVILVQGGQFAVGGAVIVGIVTVGATLIAGVPLVAWYCKMKWFKLWQAALGGATVGLALSPLLSFSPEWARDFRVAGVCTALGCGHGVAFWLIAFWKNRSLPSCSKAANQIS
jgi:hypothetical protein